ncbi:MAG: PQQ-dependent sugar dehydrogenase [Erythrobacter sp.]|jgi:glucose/arabinose dehydrogenase|nr:PQQ-dependent sugar dehydrogenase [Erythrobacter sp.]
MTNTLKASLLLSLPALALASCASAETGESASAPAATSSENAEFAIEEKGTFDRPWAIEFLPGTDTLAITQKAGTLKLMKTGNGEVVTVTGTPQVAYGGQGGLGDVAFLESEEDREDGRTIYLSWAEAGEEDDTYGAAVGRGLLVCDDAVSACAIEGLEVIWRQTPKVPGQGHYSHRIQVSPDGRYLFIASGERQKKAPAQDLSNTLGTIVRLNLDGSPTPGNPFAERGGVTQEIWSYGHRNILGMDFAPDGALWEIEHGPKGGDELNLVQRGANYGWPERSNGVNYNGSNIPDHSADDGFTKPAISWTPVIAPGDMVIYTGDMFEAWRGHALIPGLKPQALVRVAFDGESPSEQARYDFGERLRSIDVAPDGAIWVAEDGPDARLLRLSM